LINLTTFKGVKIRGLTGCMGAISMPVKFWCMNQVST